MNKLRRFLVQKVGLLLSLLLVSTAFLSACDSAGKNDVSMTNDTSSVLENDAGTSDVNSDLIGSGADKQDEDRDSQKQASDSWVNKEETVYGKADAAGKLLETNVEVLLRNPGKNSGNTETIENTVEDTDENYIEDLSTLQDIKNTKGDEEFVEQGNGVILWENHGEDIHYKGTSQAELPVSVNISYYLNDKKMSPEDMAGKSGEIRIRFDYENHASKSVSIDGKQVQVKIPFAVLSAMVLPSDVFSNIEVNGGKLMTMDDQNVVVGFAYPGLEESLQLADYEPTEDISIPDYVEVTAQAVDFKLEFTATVVTTGTFGDLDLSDLDDVDALIEDMSELTNASSELVDGTAELLDGTQTLESYMSEYVQGVDAVNEGAAALSDGLKTLNTEKVNLETGAAALQSGLESLNSALTGFSVSSSGNSDTEASSSGNSGQADMTGIDSSALAAAGQALTADAQALASQLSALQETLGQIQVFASDAAAYTATIQNTVNMASEELSAALEELNEIETNVNSTARRQAEEAAGKALADTDLSEEEKAKVQQMIADSINVSGVTDQVQSHINTAISQLTNLPALTIPELLIDFAPIMETVNDMQIQLGVLERYFDALSDMTAQLSALEGALNALKDGAGQLQDGSKKLTEGITAFNQGIEQLYKGSEQLSSGTKELSTVGGSLTDGFKTLAEGMKQLKDGVQTFDEEGIQSLSSLAGDELANIISRVKALKEADNSYDNFSGIKDGQTGSVRFIIETEEIS